MKNSSRVLFVVFVIMGLISPGRLRASSFQNGGFENGMAPSAGYRSLFTGNTDITGWVVTGRVDWSTVLGDPNWAYDGFLGAQLVSTGTPALLSQTFDTIGGASYTINFFATAVPGFPPLGGPLYIDFTNNGGTQTHTLSIPTLATYAWSPHSVSFTTAAGTASSTLAFRNIDTYVGPFLDDVSIDIVIHPTPEPANILCLGIGLLGLLLSTRPSTKH